MFSRDQKIHMHLYIYGQLVLEPHETTCVICMFQEQHQLAADTSLISQNAIVPTALLFGVPRIQWFRPLTRTACSLGESQDGLDG
ncbi:Uncharacterized protein HZ326_0991 [Fusarium oxysporum f. sp. albedinis]|nr:Uncharacterized protein HZ326_0991 [Fusarium oxysporum f. sp. albedinis]